MSDPNPYLTPATFAPEPVAIFQSNDLFRRVGNDLIVWEGAVLPQRCVKTNLPIGTGDVTKTKKLTYTPGWVWFFLLGGLLLAVILSAVLSKRVNVTYCLSKAQANRYRNRLIIGLLLLFGGVGAMFVPAMVNLGDTQIGVAIGGGFLSFLTGLIFLTQIEPLRASGFRDGWFTIKGCSKEFLDSISPM